MLFLDLERRVSAQVLFPLSLDGDPTVPIDMVMLARMQQKIEMVRD